MDKQLLKTRTKDFALRIIRLVNALPKDLVAKTIGSQLVRSETSVGANYRAACRGRSKAEFSAKLGIALEEADECIYWLELLEESKILSKKQISKIHQEANELTAILCSSIKSSQIKNPKSKI